MFDMLFTPMGFLTAFTILFIFGVFGWGIVKVNKLSKLPPAPPLEKVDD
ncbi:MAG: hypothetical protein KAH00_05705 [Cocleimonas sp.]|nr:hypothetical protein [Cocleimonas sp.]